MLVQNLVWFPRFQKSATTYYQLAEGRGHVRCIWICVHLLSMAASHFPFSQTVHRCCNPCIKTGKLRDAVFYFITFMATRRVVIERVMNMSRNIVFKWPRAFFRKLSRIDSSSLCACLWKISCVPRMRGVRHVFAFSPSSKTFHTVFLALSQESFLCFVNLFLFSSHKRYGVGAVPGQHAVVKKVLETLISSTMFPCTLAVHQSLLNASFYSFVWLRD